MDDRDYLKKYEPVLRYAYSERYFPLDIQRYREMCKLLRVGPLGFNLKTRVDRHAWVLPASQFTFLRFVDRNDMRLTMGLGGVFLLIIALAIGGLFGGLAGLQVAFWVVFGLLCLIYLGRTRLFNLLPSILVSLLFGWLAFLFLQFLFTLDNPTWRVVMLCLSPIYVPLILGIIFAVVITMIHTVLPDVLGTVLDFLSSAKDDVADEAFQLYKQNFVGEAGSSFDPVCYGRVVPVQDPQGNEWKILQYHYFYAFNDWRSAAGGVNNHEGDWEMVAVYLKNDSPYAVLYSQHHEGAYEKWETAQKARDAAGAETTHPLVYVALGSHANYTRADVIKAPKLFKAGPFQTFLLYLDALIRKISLFLQGETTLVQMVDRQTGTVKKTKLIFGDLMPESRLSDGEIKSQAAFDKYEKGLPTEYATGDGIRIGEPGGAGEKIRDSRDFLEDEKTKRELPSILTSHAWRLELISDSDPCAQYQGLWGNRGWFDWLIPDESGPPGPKWMRSKVGEQPACRLRWVLPADPLAWLHRLENKNS